MPEKPTIKTPPPGTLSGESTGYDVPDGGSAGTKPTGPSTQTTIKTTKEGYDVLDDSE